MTAQQKKYAVKRIEDLAQAKIAATDTPRRNIEFKKPTTAEIRQEYGESVPVGDLKLQHVSCGYPYFIARQGSDFCEAVTKLYERKQKEYDDARREPANPKAREIMQEAQRLSDQVMLGDSEEALKLIEAFAAKEF